MAFGVPVTANDLHDLTTLLYLEARNNPTTRDLSLVAESVINRVADRNGYFPDSIGAVIRDPGQFEPLRPGGSFHNAPEPTQAQLATALAIIDTLGNGSHFSALRTGAVFFENPETTQARGTGLTEGMTAEQIAAVTVFTEEHRFEGDKRYVFYDNTLNDWRFDRQSIPIPDWAPLYAADLQPQLEALRAHPAYAQTRQELINEFSQAQHLQPEAMTLAETLGHDMVQALSSISDDMLQSLAMLDVEDMIEITAPTIPEAERSTSLDTGFVMG